MEWITRIEMLGITIYGQNKYENRKTALCFQLQSIKIRTFLVCLLPWADVSIAYNYEAQLSGLLVARYVKNMPFVNTYHVTCVAKKKGILSWLEFQT